MKTYVGIDISKKTFDLYFEEKGKGSHLTLEQKEEDYKICVHLIGKDRICVMEATANYHIKLSNYLYEKGIKVVVENPLKIKRFSQMKLQRTKTDKADSRMIYEYGTIILSSAEHHYWQPDNKEIGYLKQYDSVRQQLIKQHTSLTNSEEALCGLTDLNTEVTEILGDLVEHIEKAIKQLDEGMLTLIKEHHSDTYDLVTSVPGIGPKTGTMIICITDGFRKFTYDQVKSFISYIGMSPRQYESGTSVRGAAHISKVGNSRLRSLLYMCSWTAKTSNQQCAVLYERLSKKGKAEKVIKIAIAHKLIRQVFGVIKRGEPFSKEYA